MAPRSPLKIAIVVHGRFHAFDLGRALIARGHNVTILTNYPGWAVQRFGVAPEVVRTFPLHGILSRMALRLRLQSRLEAPLHRLFGRWAARELGREPWDVVHLFSVIAEEAMQDALGSLQILVRGSAHIRTQARLLAQEEARTGAPQDQPTPWMIAREEREYEVADFIRLHSVFAADSFIEEGFPTEKLMVVPLGAEVEAFRALPEVVAERIRRIRAGEPLRLLYVGSKSYRKGMFDLAALARRLDPARFRIRLVGPDTAETTELLSTVEERIDNVQKQPHYELAAQYRWGDLFLFPTVEDGFATVLAQAQAAALPMLATTNCGAADLLRAGGEGWILPIRSPEAFVERLIWCDAHREEVAQMVERLSASRATRSWDDVAADFEDQMYSALAARPEGERDG